MPCSVANTASRGCTRRPDPRAYDAGAREVALAPGVAGLFALLLHQAAALFFAQAVQFRGLGRIIEVEIGACRRRIENVVPGIGLISQFRAFGVQY